MSVPSLICVGGPLVGREFPLIDPEFVVGRDAQADLAIPDQALSRRHFRIRRDPVSGDLTLIDLGSHNGTLVNGAPVREVLLAHRDEISAGNCRFLLRGGSDGPDSSGAVLRAVAREASPMTATVRLALPPAAAALAAVHERPARELAALLAISTAIQNQREFGPLAERLLGSLGEALPFRTGAVILFRDGLDEAPWTLASPKGEDASYDDTLVRAAILDGAAILEGAVLTAPLAPTGSLLRGALQLAARPGGFEESHLRLAAAAGVIAGLAFDAANRAELARAENERLRRQLELQHDMVGESASMKAVYKFVARIAAAPSTVLITGESGTGKELVAHAIHRNSPRAQKPFVAINCASLGEHLLESELFGHEKGAFTGAVAQKKGKLEIADGGTVFLDELGEMPLATQAKLLRVLQQREFERLGGTRTIAVDLRIVAATNRDLAGAVKSGAFRQDLFYRLNVVAVGLPSLRERREDIPLLAGYFTARFARRIGRPVEGLSPEARACLLQYDWPGNVRELENAIERAVVIGVTPTILPEDLPEMVVEAGRGGVPLGEEGYHAAVTEVKRRLIVEALDRAGGSVTEAARLLRLNSNYLHRLINNLGLRGGDEGGDSAR